MSIDYRPDQKNFYATGRAVGGCTLPLRFGFARLHHSR
jgi:hypothetical protein